MAFVTATSAKAQESPPPPQPLGWIYTRYTVCEEPRACPVVFVSVAADGLNVRTRAGWPSYNGAGQRHPALRALDCHDQLFSTVLASMLAALLLSAGVAHANDDLDAAARVRIFLNNCPNIVLSAEEEKVARLIMLVTVAKYGEKRITAHADEMFSKLTNKQLKEMCAP